MENLNFTIQSVKQAIAKGQFSAEGIFEHYQKRIEKENPKLNAFLTTFEYNANQRIYSNAANNNKSHFPLLTSQLLPAVPAAIKDNILIAGSICTAGSKILRNYVSTYDSTVIKKLKAAGAIFLGKTNLDEFAMGSSTENSAFGPTKNPHDLTRVPGGSSGGSAAAVAADLCVFALGSDTGGSIRQPAAFCGAVGLKPTYGRVSRSGLIAMASSLDQIGPITKKVYDAAWLLNVIAGHDPDDATTMPQTVPDYTANLEKDIKGLRVGVPKEYFTGGLDEEVAKEIRHTIQKLEELGAHIEEVSLPHSEYALAAYYLIMPSEVSANLARFDGMRYGYSVARAGDYESIIENLFGVYAKSRAEGFGTEVKRRVMLGTYALSAGYYDAYYLKAQKMRALIKRDFDDVFKKFDIIVGPTAPTAAFKFGEKSQDPLSMYLSDIYTVAVNLAGLPAISIPCGKIDIAGAKLPVGFQIITDSFKETLLLNVAYQLERALEY